ncbi:MAG: PIN domain-containing protein [Planctomycetota bacterium]
MILVILRGAFLVLVAAVITLYVNADFQWAADAGFGQVVAIIAAAIAVAAAVIAIDVGTTTKKLSAVSGVFLGLIAGLLAAYALSFLVDLVGVYAAPPEEGDLERRAAFLDLLQGVKVIIGLVTCYVAISLVLQTKDDFRFVIPYVEFAKEVRGSRPTLLDTSVIIDGRILDVLGTHVMQGTLIVPRFVLDELQTLSDSQDKLKRARGRRGLDILKKLQENDSLEVRLETHDADGTGVDAQLIDLATRLKARVMTNDFNLNKVADLRGVQVININEIANALRPVVLPGEHMHVKLVKPGESPTQGVGYLDDGTMVVVEKGRDHLGQAVDLVVTNAIQTSSGRMIFGKFAHEDADDSQVGLVDSVAGTRVIGDPANDEERHEQAAEPETPAPPSPPSSRPPGPQGPKGPSDATRSRPTRRNPRRG